MNKTNETAWKISVVQHCKTKLLNWKNFKALKMSETALGAENVFLYSVCQ